jgi:hypothetical protein
MKRYCVKCHALVETKLEWHSQKLYPDCAVCGGFPLYTLRQQLFLECFFKARQDQAYSVNVRSDMFNRKGQNGFYNLVTPTGLNMFFDEVRFGFEFWKWAELDTEQLFDHYEGDTLGLDIICEPRLSNIKTGDRFMREDGVMFEIEQYATSEGGGLLYRVVSTDDWSRISLDNFIANSGCIVDWLPAATIKAMTDKWAEGVCKRKEAIA